MLGDAVGPVTLILTNCVAFLLSVLHTRGGIRGRLRVYVSSRTVSRPAFRFLVGRVAGKRSAPQPSRVSMLAWLVANTTNTHSAVVLRKRLIQIRQGIRRPDESV